MPNLTEEQKRNIDNYKNDITQIEGSINQLRARFTLYLGARHDAGLLTMFREIFQNSVDQLLNEKSPCNFIKVLFDERTNKFIVSDNGLGIPREWGPTLFTEHHVGSHLKEKKKGEYSAGVNGIGAKAVNAASEYFEVRSYYYTGDCLHMRFEKGILKKNEIIPNKEHLQGTEIEFEPDYSIVGDVHMDPGAIYTLVRDTVSILPIGSKVDYTSINKKGKVYHELMINEDGIATNILGKCSSMLVSPIIIGYDNGTMKLDCAFTFDQQDLGGEDTTAYANLCPTSEDPQRNTHVGGVLDGVTTWFSNYMNKTYLTDRDKQKIKVNSADVRTGLKIMISAWHIEPEFTGQAKEVFSNQDFRPFAKEVIMNGLDSWAKAKSNDLVKVCKFLKDIALVRIKSDTEKVKITAKYETSATTGLPQKYVRPKSKNPKEIELFIVEGDSALSPARNARDDKFQGIFPIRGKILNVFQATPQKILANPEVVGIINILGAGYGKHFDINKIKVSKVIFMSDADSDGSHIADLLLLLCLKMFPGLVESGRVYKAIPPLYGIPMGKNKTQYFADRVDYVKYMQKEFYKKNSVTDLKGKVIEPAVFSRLLIENADYIYDFSTIMERYKLNPVLLEIVLSSYIKKDKFETLRKRIVNEFRFINNENIINDKKTNTIKIKGLINGRIETLFYNQRFIEDCEPIIEPIRKAIKENHMEFLINGQKKGLYELVSAAMESQNSIARFKGLGEMNANQLKESTMNPETRTLIQYTVDDINETMKIIRQYDSNKKMILQKVGSVNREDLIGL